MYGPMAHLRSILSASPCSAQLHSGAPLLSSCCFPRRAVVAEAMADSEGNVLGWSALRTSILDCFNEHDGSIDIEKYLDHAADVCSRQRSVTGAVLDLISGDDIVAESDSADVTDTAAS